MSERLLCPICNVTIDGDLVQFSHGGAGTKSRLWARVCRHATKEGCINDFGKGDAQFSENDDFGKVETHEEEVLEMMKQWFKFEDEDPIQS
ncbi:MAG: hypothetical protein AB4040_08915 [Synechococcus sp.]